MKYSMLLLPALLGALSVLALSQDRMIDRAAEHVQNGRWKEAAGAYEQLVQSAPSDANYWSGLGYSRYMLRQYKRAAEAYEKALEIRKTAGAMYNLACVYSLLDQKLRSLDWLEKAAEGGFNQTATLMQDEDLKNVRTEKRFAVIVERVQRNAAPCEFDPEHRRFDFWIGEWNVKNHAGQPVGKSRIEKMLGGCVILENWTGGTGYEGKSLNFIDPGTGKWRQTWVDNRGGKIEFTGSFDEKGNLVYYADATDQNGKPIRRRLTFFNLADGRVRQFSQRSMDNEKTWHVEYDFTYAKN